MKPYTVPVSTLTHIAFHLNSVIDAELHQGISINQMNLLIRDGTVFEQFVRQCWIDEDYPIWRISTTDEAELLAEWQYMAKESDEGRMMGVENNGVCLLVGYLLDGIQRRATPQA